MSSTTETPYESPTLLSVVVPPAEEGVVSVYGDDDSDDEENPSENQNEEGDDGIFSDVNAYSAITKVQSMCMECEETGTTNFMLTAIPFFREVIISSFRCPHCGYVNVGIDSAGKVQQKGKKFTLRVTKKEDLNRSVVKADTCIVRLPDLDFEIPSNTQKGKMTTIEGLLQTSYENLDLHQAARRLTFPDQAAAIDIFLQKLKSCLEVEQPFVVIVDDPAGNSYMSSPYAPQPDPEMIVFDYERDAEQNAALGISSEQTDREMFRKEREKEELDKLNAVPADEVGVSSFQGGDEFARASGSKVSQLLSENIGTAMSAADLEKDVVSFTVPCTSCPEEGNQRMVKIQIPYFKEVVVMSFVCDHCGEKNNEIKVGGGISEKGKKFTLDVLTAADLNRDILKSETADIHIPEIDFQMGMGSMGGQFTTVEGLISRIRQDLGNNPFVVGDSGDKSAKENFTRFFSALERYRKGEEPFTLIIDDPVANSYIQNLHAPAPDPQLKVEVYVRNYEQDDDLGLHDMVTEGYYEKEEKEEKEAKEEKEL